MTDQFGDDVDRLELEVTIVENDREEDAEDFEQYITGVSRAFWAHMAVLTGFTAIFLSILGNPNALAALTGTGAVVLAFYTINEVENAGD